MKRAAIIAGLALLSVPVIAQTPPAGSGTQVVNPFRGVMQDRSSHSPDEALFVEKCGMCHRQMGMGTVLLARRMAPALARLSGLGRGASAGASRVGPSLARAAVR